MSSVRIIGGSRTGLVAKSAALAAQGEVVRSVAGALAFSLPATITKIDEDKRTVYGVATAEVLDSHGEIVDYDTAKACVLNGYAGNIREMHQLIAAGSAVSIECDDDAREIRLAARISKGAEPTWQKVLDGTLKMFSIGGRARERRAEKVGDVVASRLIMDAIHEISLVDVGACPAARFSIVKTNDAGVLEVDASLEAAPADPPEDEPKADAALEPAPAASLEADPAAAPAAPTDPSPAEPAAKVAAPALAPAAVKAAAPVAPAHSAIDHLAHAAALAAAGPGGLADAAAAVVSPGSPASPPVAKAADPAAIAMEPDDVSQAAALVSALNNLLSWEVCSARWDARDGKDITEQMAQVELLRSAVEEVLSFLWSEFHEQFGVFDLSPMAEPESGADVAAAAGARRDRMLKALGRLTPDVSKAISGVSDVRVAGLTADLEKATATATAQAVTIAELQSKVAALGKAPAPGGPHARAVDKTLAGGAAPVADLPVDQAMSAVEKLAAAATTDAERTALATLVVKLQTQSGLNRLSTDPVEMNRRFDGLLQPK
jgi:hypothetical protein